MARQTLPDEPARLIIQMLTGVLIQFISQIFTEKRPVDTVGVNVAAKLCETVGLSLILTWWGTRTNPFD
jgi:hypothetical protein